MNGGAGSFLSQHDVRKALLDYAMEPYSLDEEQPMLLTWLCEGMLLDLLQAMNAANGTRHFVDPQDSRDDWYLYTTRNRQWKLDQEAGDASIDAAVQHVTSSSGWRVSADAVVNRDTATVDEPRAPDWPTLVWTYDLLPPLPVTVPVGTPLSLDASFADYVLDCPEVVVTLAAGSAAYTGYRHHGQTGDLTITATGSDATVTGISVHGRIVDRAPTATYTADGTGQALPRGVRDGPPVGGDFAGPMVTARGLSDHLVWRYSDQPVRGGVLRPALTVANWLPHGLRVDLYDVVSVSSPQLRVSGRLFEVVGIDEQWHRAADSGAVFVEQALQLQECRLQAADALKLFRLDSSALDGTDVLAY